jgi:hypothetical protein
MMTCDYCGGILPEKTAFMYQFQISIRKYANVSLHPLNTKWILCPGCYRTEKHEDLAIRAKKHSQSQIKEELIQLFHNYRQILTPFDGKREGTEERLIILQILTDIENLYNKLFGNGMFKADTS